MYFNGKGEDMFDDITEVLSQRMEDTQFIKQWGQELYDIIHSNFAVDLLQALKLGEEGKNKAVEELNRRISMFCAAFV